ncbi:hypothetical protein E2553_42320 [Paraburkholderia dipogonis]|uniref:Uncharacterized protein n=1 Tax=Paraburkholderia dipogonis TaxID=1211383 RepID=A0A4Y8MG96_9BURK|nr:hypothetical protein E2553_42320 [Paraburkholderia dipogonis]
MVILLSNLSKICFGWALLYLLLSFLSALKIGRRHYQSLIFLEFQPGRARGPWELRRARLMLRMKRCTVLLVLFGVISLVACVFVH